MPIYEINTDQGVYEIDADREPTQAEAMTAISNLPRPAVRASPTSEQEAFEQQFIAAGTQTPSQQALGALAAPFRAGTGLVTGIGDLALKGVQGVGSIAGGGNVIGDVIQTAGEVVPRASFDIANAIRQAFQSPQAATASLRGLNTLSNPIASAIQAFAQPQLAPTQAQAQQAFQDELVNRAFEEQAQQGVASVGQRALGLVPAGTANIDVARAAPLLIGAEVPAAAGVRALASPVQTARSVLGAVAPRVAARTAPATVEQSAMAALDITREEVARHVPIINQRVLEIQKAPKTASEALKAANTAEASLYQDALVADKAATQQGLGPRSDLILQNVEETLNNIPTLLPEERVALLQDARARYSDVSTPAKGRALQQRLNKEFQAQYANDTFDRAAPANEVKLAVRNSIAEQMDEINKAVTGVDATPYSDIGSLIEFKGNLGKQIQRIEGAEARSKTGLASAKPSRIPTSKTEAALQIKRSALSPLQKTQLEKLDQNVSRLFTEGEAAGEAIALDPAVQQALIAKYSPRQAPPPLPVVAPTLEKQIQQTIQQLPREMRGRNERAIAESILRSETSNVSPSITPIPPSQPNSLTNLAYRKIIPDTDYTSGGIARALEVSDFNVVNDLIQLGIIERTPIGTYRLIQ